MPALLVVEDLDVVEELLLGVRVALESLAELGLQRREPALGHGVVVAVPATAHAARDSVSTEDVLVVLARVGAALIGVVHQPGIGTPTSQRHLECPNHELPIVDGGERPTDDEARVQVDDGGQEDAAALADSQLGGVADPALIRTLVEPESCRSTK